MKAAIFTLTVLFASAAQASVYNCALTDGRITDPKGTTFSIDTETEDNKFVKLENSLSVGCIVFRSTPELLTCGLGQEEKFSMFVTAESTTSVLALDSASFGTKASLRCVRQN